MRRPHASRTVLAVATALTIVVVGSAVYLFPRDRRPTAPPVISAATIALRPLAASALAVGHGSMWVPTGDVITRLDSRSSDVIARIHMFGLEPEALAFGAGSLWAVDMGIDGPGLVDRIDPTTNEVVARIALDGQALPTAMAVAHGDVWVAYEGWRPGVIQIDGATNAVVDRLVGRGFSAGAPEGSDTSLWLGLRKIDPVTKRTVLEVRIPGGVIDLAISGRTLWAVTLKGSVFGVDVGSGEIRTSTRVGRHYDLIAASEDDVWVARSQPVRGRAGRRAAVRVVQVDADSGQIVSRRSLQGRILALVADEYGAWVARPSNLVRFSGTSRGMRVLFGDRR